VTAARQRRLRWVNALCVTPFDEHGHLDEDALARLVDRLASEEIGIYLGDFSVGEGHALRPREARRMYEIGVAAAAGRAPVYAAALGFTSTDRLIEQAIEAEELGVDAVQILPPRLMPAPGMPRMAELEQFYAQVLDEVRGPVHLCDHVVMSGYRLPGDLLGDLVTAFSSIEAVNVSDPDLDAVALLVAALGARVAVRVGLVGHLPTALLLGGQGVLCFEAAVASQLCREVIDTFRAGEMDGWRASFQRLVLLNIALTRAPVPQSVKGAMALLGSPVGDVRRPRQPLGKEEEHEIAESLRSLGLIGPDR
jgi:4-hydroxy-tetrahydrodipicolinate synthase